MSRLSIFAASLAASIAGICFFANPDRCQSFLGQPCLKDSQREMLRKTPEYKAAYAKYSKPFASLPANRKADPARVAQSCFAEGTPPEVVAAFTDAMIEGGVWPNPMFQPEYDLGALWGAAGTPRVITWSFMPDGTPINDSANSGMPNGNSTLFATMDARFGGNRAQWIAQFEAIFARWSQITGLTYQRVTVGGNPWDDGAAFFSPGAAGLRGDVRIGAKAMDGSSGVLAYNYFPSTGDMVIDSAESWGSATNSFRFLRNTLGHEHGHGFGLRHSCPSNGSKLMEPFLNTGFDGPQQDDARAGQRGYGDPSEPNNSAAAATNLGTGVAGITTYGSDATTNVTRLSIEGDGVTDWFKLDLPAGATIVATATPVGTSYSVATQNNTTGACNASSTVNALAMADLAVDLRAPDGITILNSASGAAAGVAEVATATTTVAGSHYIRVFETNAPAESQQYRLSVNITMPQNKIVTGFVNLSSWGAATNGITLTMEIRGVSGVLQTLPVTLGANGSYSAQINSSIVNGNYNLSLKGVRWLRDTIGPIAIGSTGATGANFTMRPGDCSNDNSVDLSDYLQMAATFDLSQGNGGYDFAGDLNGDNTVDLSDYLILAANFDLSGDN